MELQAERASLAVALSERKTLIDQLHHDLSIRPWAIAHPLTLLPSCASVLPLTVPTLTVNG